MAHAEDMSDGASSSSLHSVEDLEDLYWTCCFSYKATVGCSVEMRHSSQELDDEVRASWTCRHVPDYDDDDDNSED